MRRRLTPYTKTLLNLWPPLRFAGIRVVSIAPGFTAVDVEMRMHWWNRNIVGVHYGGSIFSMTDPFYMMMLMQQLGDGYIVWDKAASIRFRRPGRGTLRARYRVTPEQVAEIKRDLELAIATADEAESRPPRVEPVFAINVTDAEGTTVAEVARTLHIQRKLSRAKG